MEHKVIKDKRYLVSTKTETTVTDSETGWKKVIPANKQEVIVALSEQFTTEGECIVRPFGNAPAIIGESGGGVEIKFDTTPTQNSTNAVTSGGLYTLLYGSSVKLGGGTGSTAAKAINIGGGEANVNNEGSVGVGSSVWNVAKSSITIGDTARAYGDYSVAIGGRINYGWTGSRSKYGVVIGASSQAGAFDKGIVIGAASQTQAANATAIGTSLVVKDESTMALGVQQGTTSQTVLYLIAAGSPLANSYEDGAACLGYVVKDASGNIIDCGTRKLSELLTNHGAFAPAGDEEPTPFLPTGITDPIELPEMQEEV